MPAVNVGTPLQSVDVVISGAVHSSFSFAVQVPLTQSDFFDIFSKIMFAILHWAATPAWNFFPSALQLASVTSANFRKKD